jgi:hypothetical protein
MGGPLELEGGERFCITNHHVAVVGSEQLDLYGVYPHDQTRQLCIMTPDDNTNENKILALGSSI